MKDVNATVITNLECSEEELLRNLHKDARWGVKRAIRNGLIVEESEDWDIFYEMYLNTMSERKLIVRSLDFVKKDSDVLLLCKYKGKPISGVTIKIGGNYNDTMPRLSKNASFAEYLHLQPNNLLYWRCLLWAKQKNFKDFEWGGYQINAKGQLSGVNKFKQKWGKIVHYSKNYPFHIAIGRKLIRNIGLLKWLSTKLKKGGVIRQ